AVSAAALRILCRGVLPNAGTVQRARGDQGGRLPRHGRTLLRPEGRAAGESTGGAGGGMRRVLALALLFVASASAVRQAASGSTGMVAASDGRIGASGPTARILVMPFENVTREGRIFWLTEAAAVLLSDDLQALGTDAITREERREAF